jgi:hypothetical protein
MIINTLFINNQKTTSKVRKHKQQINLINYAKITVNKSGKLQHINRVKYANITGK